MQRDIIHRFAFPQPPEVVWEYLTKPQLLELWLMKSDFKPEVGHKFQFGTEPKLKIGFDGRVHCQVLEIDLHKKPVYSWKGRMSKENPSLDSVVVWTLTPSGSGTILQLEHKGCTGIKNFLPYLIMNKGWLKIGNRLLAQLNLTQK